MRKRLRKKLGLGEFRTRLFDVWFKFPPALTNEERDGLLDGFISAVEANGLQFGGGGSGNEWSGCVELRGPARGSPTEEQRSALVAWFEAHPGIIEHRAGELRYDEVWSHSKRAKKRFWKGLLSQLQADAT